MNRITIDHIPIEVADGTTVMQAAGLLGIEIPSLCYRNGNNAHPSCMVCMVKDARNGKLFPSCAMPVADGMDIITASADLVELRKEAVELLLSDHVGDCEAPCRVSCPAFMNIPLMNRLIAEGDFEKALEVVREEIALPLILGYICPAPCEKACRRKPIDGAVSICLLKRSTAADDLRRNKDLRKNHEPSGKRIAIAGSGPAGLSAAFYLLRMGHDCIIFDKAEKPGGSLRYLVPEDKLPVNVLDTEIEGIRNMGASFRMNVQLTSADLQKGIYGAFDALILATGSRERNPIEGFNVASADGNSLINRKTYETGSSGIFACGSIIRDQNMAVRAAAQGHTAARSLDAWLRTGKTSEHKVAFNSVIGLLEANEYAEYLKESAPGKQIEPKTGFMGGFSEEEAINEAKRCMHCDCRKLRTCRLRLRADEYQVNRKRFSGVKRKQLIRSVQHDRVVYEPEKCIRCGICVEIGSRANTKFGMAFLGRGYDVSIAPPLGRTTIESLENTADECVRACPTGALAFKTGEDKPEDNQ